jgi:hypothetical protein
MKHTLISSKLLCCIVLVFGNIKVLFAQDSLLVKMSLSNECQGQHNLAAIASGGIGGVTRWGTSNAIISNNPIFHFAIYDGIILKTTLNQKYSIESGLFLEERSYSNGNNTLKNLIIFPKIKLSLIDSFKIAKYFIKTSIKAGDFWNEDFQDFIRFYNIDFHALEVNFGVKQWNFKANVIGDLSQNIGLDLHEMYKFQLQYKQKRSLNSIALSINELFVAPLGFHPQEQDYNLTYYGKYLQKGQNTFEVQADVRINRINQLSKAIGVKWQQKINNTLNFNTAIRYFDKEYNQGYANIKPRYRGGVKTFIGEQLYPLKNYYRPMNQWAFLTSHQSKDLINFELNANFKIPVYKKLTFFSSIDFNIIYELNGKNVSFYPLYNTGFNVNFTKNFILTLSITNKQMNLDTFYQTFYSSKRPLFSYNFKYILNDLALGSKKVI